MGMMLVWSSFEIEKLMNVTITKSSKPGPASAIATVQPVGVIVIAWGFDE